MNYTMEHNQEATPSTSQQPQQSYNTYAAKSVSRYSDRIPSEQHFQLLQLPMDKYSLNVSGLKYKKNRKSKKCLPASCMKQRKRYVDFPNGTIFTQLYKDRKIAASRIYVCNSNLNMPRTGLSASTCAGSFIMVPKNHHSVRMFKQANLQNFSLMRPAEYKSVLPEKNAKDSINDIVMYLKDCAQKFEKRAADKNYRKNCEMNSIDWPCSCSRLSIKCNLNVDSAKMIDDLLDMEEEYNLHSNMQGTNNSPNMDPSPCTGYYDHWYDMLLRTYGPDLSNKFDNIKPEFE